MKRRNGGRVPGDRHRPAAPRFSFKCSPDRQRSRVNLQFTYDGRPPMPNSKKNFEFFCLLTDDLASQN